MEREGTPGGDARVAAANGVELAVRRWPGDRAPGFVLVHGLASNLETWGGVARELAAGGYPVVAYDQRGHGRSDRPSTGYDLATFVDDLDAVLAWSGLAAPVLAGQSWGGNLVLAHAARRRAAAAVVCVDGGTIDLAAQFPTWDACAEALRPPTLAIGLDAVEARLRAAHPDWPEAGIAATLANLKAGDGGAARNRLPLAAHMALLRTMWDHPPGDLYPDVAVPVLFLLAETGDGAWTAAKRAAAARAIAALPDAVVEWLPGDHDLHVQQPALVAARLRDGSLGR